MDGIVQTALENAGLVGAAAIIGGCSYGLIVWIRERRASFAAYFEHRRSIRIQRGLLMGKKKKSQRDAYIKGRWCDGITEFGEREFFEGRQTREEVNAVYRMFGKTHGMVDLIPVLTPAQAKSAIKGRRSRGTPVIGQDNPSWGDPPKVTADPSYNVIDAKKAFGAKALKILKTA